MNHRRHLKKLNRTAAHRRADLRNLAQALVEHERIETTEAKAKALRPYFEKIITLGKKGTLAGTRLAAQRLGNSRSMAAKLVQDIVPRFADRPGGYTRIIKVRSRRGDNAPLALIELTERKESESSPE